MKRMAVQIAAGIVAVGLFLGWIEMSGRERERRHATRPDDETNAMLELAHVSRGDTIFDLECGDGGVVVAAAKRYGARGWCFDTYPQRLTEARDRARREGVQDLITFSGQFWDSVDVSPASVVIIGFTDPVAEKGYKVRGQLTRLLRPGSRILSPWIPLGDWEPTAVVQLPHPTNRNRLVRLWIADGIVRP